MAIAALFAVSGWVRFFAEVAMTRAFYFVGLAAAIYVLSIADVLAAPVAAVPEPTSLSLLAVGFGAFAIARLRKKK